MSGPFGLSAQPPISSHGQIDPEQFILTAIGKRLSPQLLAQLKKQEARDAFERQIESLFARIAQLGR